LDLFKEIDFKNEKSEELLLFLEIHWKPFGKFKEIVNILLFFSKLKEDIDLVCFSSSEMIFPSRTNSMDDVKKLVSS